MQIRFLICLVVCAFATTGWVHAAAAGGLKPGSVLVAKVTGTAEMIDAAGAKTALARGAQLLESSRVVTGSNSGAVLVFSNGATLQLGENSDLVLEEYKQGEFAGSVKVSEMVEEPSQSKTRVYLNRGELIGKVKKLKLDQNSEFTVRTPVGAAGIRGTTFRIVFTPTGTGAAFLTSPWLFQLSTTEGAVTFDPGSRGPGGGGGPGTGGPGGGAPAVDVNGGVQIILTVNVQELPSGQYLVTVQPTIQSPVELPAPLRVQVEKAAGEMALAAERALFQSGGSSLGTVSGTFTPDPPPPPPQSEQQRTTPGS